MCFLLSLVDHEEIGELDFSDIVSNKKSMFATLLTNEENMKVWALITLTCIISQNPVNSYSFQVNQGFYSVTQKYLV